MLSKYEQLLAKPLMSVNDYQAMLVMYDMRGSPLPRLMYPDRLEPSLHAVVMNCIPDMNWVGSICGFVNNN